MKVTDFARSYCYYVPEGHSIWVRIQMECCCEVVDDVTQVSDEYVLGVRTQTGLRTDPPSDVLDPGYDFWMIFSRKHIFIRRTHASSAVNNPTRVPVEEFISTGWERRLVSATQLQSAAEILDALKAGLRIVARTEFVSGDGERRYRIEYPIKWADGDAVNDVFRVETGPVLLLDVERISAGRIPEFSDFQWAYLDYHDFDHVRCLLERPTSILSGSLYGSSRETPERSSVLTAEGLKQLEARLFEGWDPPIPVERLRQLFETNHYSAVSHRRASTSLFAIDEAANDDQSRHDNQSLPA